MREEQARSMGAALVQKITLDESLLRDIAGRLHGAAVMLGLSDDDLIDLLKERRTERERKRQEFDALNKEAHFEFHRS